MIAFRFLISLEFTEKLEMRSVVVVIIFYMNHWSEFYNKIFGGFKMIKTFRNSHEIVQYVYINKYFNICKLI